MSASQDADHTAVFDRNAASLRGRLVTRSTESNSELLHFIERSARNIVDHENPSAVRVTLGYGKRAPPARRLPVTK